MYTLKGIFPEPKKEQKKNFIKENVKQLKNMQGRTSNEVKPSRGVRPDLPNLLKNTGETGHLSTVKSSASNQSGAVLYNVVKTSSFGRKKKSDATIKKGDMAEFLKRKQNRLVNKEVVEVFSNEENVSRTSSGRLRDIGCQTIESNFVQKSPEDTKLTVLYTTKENDESKLKASGDTEMQNNPKSSQPSYIHFKGGDNDVIESARNRSRINAILEKKDNKDPYLPAGYQKGVLPKYLRDRKAQDAVEAENVIADDAQAVCPPGHVTLPDVERKETLRMLRNSFAELVNELNKMPVKSDTLRMRNRKMELERQLSKLEEGIKVFSRSKVFVKVGE